MSTRRTATGRIGALVRRPDQPVGYVAIGLAAITGVIHLLLALVAFDINQTLGILFALNGLGFVGGIGLYLSRYWRRELFLVAALYALVTILAFFAWNDWEVVSAFYRQGQLNPLAVGSKSVEALLVVCALYLYARGES